ncbi:Hypothetical Protein FCC1311_069202 [Hondaea fermentalgiana]|uniref:Uncharacterized protein n=1 Tax=Hondaea fermentalgiana TaxID=2315210 RepID=A0A2R5GIH9_9STRA|nr:Hypothetical Protein FCC1311_069202 [Hondaea fermentalgiana]|eukprot:GBG30700.1 Hypothetical Protein FCC1311_069202 [Hondaea fermentalgiana]
MPHGLSGTATLALGARLTLGSLRGVADPDADAGLVGAYLVAAAANAVAAVMMAHLAPPNMRTAFRLASALQVGLVWFAGRFFMDQGEPAPPQLRAVDQFMTLLLIGPVLGFAFVAGLTVAPVYGKATASAVAVGSASMLLLCGYPLQLAFMDPSWYGCVLDRYPAQRAGFVQFVYIPASFCFAAVMFGATLLNRKIISGIFFGVFFIGCILVTLFATVLMQEVYIPVVSTQKLVILCPEPAAAEAPKSLLQTLSRVLDTSRLAQVVLASLGVQQVGQPRSAL